MITKEWLRTTEGGPIVLTGRSFEVVHEYLRLPHAAQLSKLQVLSIGEGLSNYAQTLKNEFGVRAVAIDPLYQSASIFQQEKQEVQYEVSKYFGDQVIVRNIERSNLLDSASRLFPKLANGDLVAGSIYDLPFASHSVDLITANRVFEHIIFPESISELLRVIKETGEIRLSGLFLTGVPSEGYVYDHILNPIDRCSGVWVPHQGLGNGFEILSALKRHQNISSYLVFDQFPKPKVRSMIPNALNASMLIIRCDDTVPYLQTQEIEPIEPQLFLLSDEPGYNYTTTVKCHSIDPVRVEVVG